MVFGPKLSIVVPAYNEENRLPTSLRSIGEFLDRQAYTSEVIVVDDGSEDRTRSVVEACQATSDRITLIRNPHRGKAFAVRTGMLASRGDVVFMCDADLSMPVSEITKFLPLIDKGYGVVIGSREAPGAHRIGEPGHRHLMGRVFNWIVQVVALDGFQDTQCGFKCFRRDAALEIFPRLRVRTDDTSIVGPMVTGFDVEVLYLAKKLGYRIAEVGVEWHYAPGSKVDSVRDSLRMIADVIKVRINDRRGWYKLPRTASREVASG